MQSQKSAFLRYHRQSCVKKGGKLRGVAVAGKKFSLFLIFALKIPQLFDDELWYKIVNIFIFL